MSRAKYRQKEKVEERLEYPLVLDHLVFFGGKPDSIGKEADERDEEYKDNLTCDAKVESRKRYIDESEGNTIGSKVKYRKYSREDGSPYAWGRDEYIGIRFEGIELIDDRKQPIDESPRIICSRYGKKTGNEKQKNRREECIDAKRNVGNLFGDKKIIGSFQGKGKNHLREEYIDEAPDDCPPHFIADFLVAVTRNFGEFLFKCRLVLNNASRLFAGLNEKILEEEKWRCVLPDVAK